MLELPSLLCVSVVLVDVVDLLRLICVALGVTIIVVVCVDFVIASIVCVCVALANVLVVVV